MDDKDLREFFHENRPQTTDEGTFLAGLSAKLDAAAEIKLIQEKANRHCRRITLAALLSGLLLGGAVMALLLLHPVGEPHIDTKIIAAVVRFAVEWKSVLIFLIVAAATVLGTLPLSRRQGV